MRQTYLSALLILLSTGFLSAQSDLAIGQWRDHLPYRRGLWVTQSDSLVYYATDFGLVTIDKTDFTTELLSTVDGFSEAGPQVITYHAPTGTLVIAYASSVLDLWKADGISSMPQIQNFTGISGDKSINRMVPRSDSTLLLAASYGISEIDLKREEFRFTTFTGIAARDVAIFRDTFYVSTDEGIYRAPVSLPNPADFSQWQLMGPETGFPADYSCLDLAVFNETLYAILNDSLFAYQPGQGRRLIDVPIPKRDLTYLAESADHLLIGYSRCNDGSCGSRVGVLDRSGNLQKLGGPCPGVPVYAAMDQQDRIWMADAFDGFRILSGLDENQCEELRFNTPPTSSNYEMTFWENQLWLASGGLNLNLGNRFIRDGFSSYIDGQWTTFNTQTQPLLNGDPNDFNDTYLDFIAVAVQPSTGHVFAGSFMRGIAEWDGEEMRVYNETNSALQPSTDPELGDIDNRVRVAGIAFDRDNNMWVTNTEAPRPLVVRSPEGTWQSFAVCGSNNRLYQIAIDNNGFKWMTAWTGGLYVYDEGVLDDPGDDRCRFFSNANSNLPTNRVRCVAADLDGDIWVGTEQGVVIFECGGSAFDPEICQGTLRPVETDGFLGFLLETEDVTSIAVDGANRKWVGTQNGLFLLSPDGREELARFTTENAPLLDNAIIDIAVNPDNGEVWFGTQKGIIAYKGDAVAGGTTHAGEIEVFPNPVRPEYEGPITIRGLPRDAEVKITDINGRLVFETLAQGGQAIWDGRDYNGRKVATGVYLIFSSSNSRFAGFDGKSDAATGKIVFIN